MGRLTTQKEKALTWVSVTGGSSSSLALAGVSGGSTPSSSPGKAPRCVVNDLGAEIDGSGSSAGPAGQVVDEIRGMGGEAVANGDDVSDYEGAGRLIRAAIETFGTIDVLVNNAGILRDRMLVNMTIEEWDAVIRVHLRGTFAPTRHAVDYWRNRVKVGETNDARIINTTSPSGIYGNVGQTNYGAAKAGHRLVHHHRRHGARPLRGHRQCHRAGCVDPHDREPGPG